MLSSWLDAELGPAESERIHTHLRHCESCREQTAAWVTTVAAIGPSAPPAVVLSEGCPDAELLVAYSEGPLASAEAKETERHLADCGRCVDEVRRLIRLRVAQGATAVASLAPARAEAPSASSADPRQPRRLLRNLWDAVAGFQVRPAATGGLVAATALLLIVAARLLPVQTGETLYRGLSATAQIEIVADDVAARTRPSRTEAVVAVLRRGTIARHLEASAGWVRIELSDGRRVWVEARDVLPFEPNRRRE